MKNFKSFLVALISLFATLSIQAQSTEAPKQVLESGDFDKMIKTYKPMVKEFEKLGLQYEDMDSPTTLQALKANKEVQAILNKYGWSESFYPKFMAMIQGVSIIEMEKQFEDIPEEQKEYMGQMIDQYQLANKDKIHPSDLALVRSNHAKLMKFFEEQE